MNKQRVLRWLSAAAFTSLCLVAPAWEQNEQSIAATDSTVRNERSATIESNRQTGSQADTQTSKSENARFDNKATSDNSKGETEVVKRLNTSANVLDEIMGAPDNGIPKDVLAHAKCIAVVPSMVNIAVIFGGRHGKGVATCRTANGWSAPAPIDITGGSWGLQIGGQATDLVMLIMNQKGMDHLLSSKFKVGGEVTGAAGPVGREAAADTDWKMKAEILSYSRSRGLFAGIDLNGASIKQDKDETAVLYGGKVIPFEEILGGKVAPPDGAHTFLATIRKYANQAAEERQGS
jgi:lipid-binding SYLF domain-containing protein